jgi:hypothetical protein
MSSSRESSATRAPSLCYRTPRSPPWHLLPWLVGSVSWAIVHGRFALGAHAMFGLVLVVVLALLALHAIGSGDRAVGAWSSLGGLFVIGGAFNGASFLDYNENISSLIMALLAFASHRVLCGGVVRLLFVRGLAMQIGSVRAVCGPVERSRSSGPALRTPIMR